MSSRAYDQYKESGVDWLGRVPTAWDVLAIKRRFEIVGGSTPKSGEESLWEGDIRWATPSDLSKLDSIYLRDTQRTITDAGLESCGTTLVPTGSIILSTRAPIGSLAIADAEMCTNQGCKSLVPCEESDSKYFAYLLSISSDELNIRGKGTTFLELSADELGAFEVPSPPLPEQRTIASFLDTETSKIDSLVSEQRRLIELLKEKRQAVISRAVTKGLDPSVEMKESGIVGFGNVPEHWVVKKFGWLLRESPKNGTSPQINANGQTPTFSIAAVKNGTTDIRSHLKYADISFEDAQPYLVQKEDILVLRGNGNKTLVGTAGIVANEPPDKCIYPDILIRIRPSKQITSWYLVTVLNSDAMRPAVEMAAQTASGIWKISGKSLQDLRVAVPPPDEQLDIERECQKQMETFNQLQSQAERAIELLQERRTALISAAVTGKIDVREFALGELV